MADEKEKTIEAGLKALGTPREVLPVAIVIAMQNAKSGGHSPEEFIASLMPMLLAVWGVDHVNVERLAAALVRKALAR